MTSYTQLANAVPMGIRGGNGAEPQRRTILDAQQQQALIIDQLHKAISILAEKLSPVLEAEPPNREGEAKDAQSSVNVIERIELGTRFIENAVHRIAALTNRVQL